MKTLMNWNRQMNNHETFTANWYEIVLDIKASNPNWVNNLINVAKMVEDTIPEPEGRGSWDFDILNDTSIDLDEYFDGPADELIGGFDLAATIMDLKDRFTPLDILQMQSNILKSIIWDQHVQLYEPGFWFKDHQFQIVAPSVKA